MKVGKRRWVWVGLGIGLAGGAVALSSFEKDKNLDASLLVTVKRDDLAIEVIDTGKIEPRERIEVKSKVAGQVAEVLVEEGAVVKKGQLLLRLDPTDFQREAARAEADLALAQNALEYAKLHLARKRRSLEDRGVAQIEVDLAANEVKAKQAAARVAEVALAAARDRLRYTEILSPLDGTVIERSIEPGEVVTPGVQATFEGRPLMTVADLSALVVKAELNQIDVAKVRLGQLARLTLDSLPGKTYEATIIKVAPAAIKPKGREIEVFPVEAKLVIADPEIKPGMTADVRFLISTRTQTLSIPIEAVVKESGKTFVQKVALAEGKQSVSKEEVTLGERNDHHVEVVKGIAEGEQLVINPGSATANEAKL